MSSGELDGMWGESGLPDVLPTGYGESVADRGGPNMYPPGQVPRGSYPPYGPGTGTDPGPGWGAVQLAFRDVTDNTYVYRQFSDNTIEIVATGNAKAMPIGTRLTSTGPNVAAFSAITAKIGTWESFKKGQTASFVTNTLPSLMTAVTTGLSTAASAPPPKRYTPSKHSAPAPMPAQTTDTSSGISPFWLIGGGVLLIGGIVAIAAMTGGKEKEDKK